MSIIQKIVAKHKQKQATEYFNKKMDKVIVKGHKLSYLLKDPEKGLCYYYSSFAILGLTGIDLLVRGKVRLPNHTESDYRHGWVEFKFEGNWWVFDDRCGKPIKKEEYYQQFQPVIESKISLSYMLNYIEKTYGKNISKREIWDNEFLISLPYVKLDYDSEENRVVIDQNNKFFVHDHGCETHWI